MSIRVCNVCLERQAVTGKRKKKLLGNEAARKQVVTTRLVGW